MFVTFISEFPSCLTFLHTFFTKVTTIQLRRSEISNRGWNCRKKRTFRAKSTSTSLESLTNMRTFIPADVRLSAPGVRLTERKSHQQLLNFTLRSSLCPVEGVTVPSLMASLCTSVETVIMTPTSFAHHLGFPTLEKYKIL